MKINIQLFGIECPPLYDNMKLVQTIAADALKELKSANFEKEYVEHSLDKIVEICRKASKLER